MSNSYALMQPSFLPWIGWFALMDHVDEFIYFDNADFSRQSWHHRNYVKSSNGRQLITIPIGHGKGDTAINRVRLTGDHRVKKKILSSISQNYSKAPFFNDYFPHLEKIISDGFQSGSLLTLNMNIINWGREALGITTSVKFSSDLNATGERGRYVADVGRCIDSSNYVSPVGAREYLEEDELYFDKRNIKINFFNFSHPVYNQANGNFVPYCSFIDLLFNEGDLSLGIIRTGAALQVLS